MIQIGLLRFIVTRTLNEHPLHMQDSAKSSAENRIKKDM